MNQIEKIHKINHLHLDIYQSFDLPEKKNLLLFCLIVADFQFFFYLLSTEIFNEQRIRNKNKMRKNGPFYSDNNLF